MLLEPFDFNPNTVDEDGETALFWAANKGHEGVLKLLLEWDYIDRNFPNKSSTTPLSIAVCKGYEAVVKRLLELLNVDSNTARVGKDSKTPLFWATPGGHKGVVNMLLKRDDISPDACGKYDSSTLLTEAAGIEQDGVCYNPPPLAQLTLTTTAATRRNTWI